VSVAARRMHEKQFVELAIAISLLNSCSRGRLSETPRPDLAGWLSAESLSDIESKMECKLWQ
jgi:hypothetical protein